MINEGCATKYCNEDISLIKNYDKAVKDKTQTWECHHRNETDKNLTVRELNELDLYFNRPASELIFLTSHEHMSLHNKGEYNPMYGKDRTGKNNGMYGKHHSEEWRKKHSEKMKGKHRTLESRKKQSESMKDKHHSEETRKKQSESMKGKNIGKPCGPKGKHRVYDNKELNIYHYE